MNKQELFQRYIIQEADRLVQLCKQHDIGLLIAIDATPSEELGEERDKDTVLTIAEPNSQGLLAGSLVLAHSILTEQAPRGMSIEIKLYESERGELLDSITLTDSEDNDDGTPKSTSIQTH